MTVRELFRRTVRVFRESGIPFPAREVRLLLGKLLGTSPARVYLFWDRKVSEKEENLFAEFVNKRLSGIPLQYVLEEWEFFSLPFKVRQGVFIPRVDTEAWVEEAVLLLHFLSGRKEKLFVCDLCCGNGAIGLSCAFFVPAVSLFGVDISKEAVALAEENARVLGLAERSRFFVGDLFTPLTSQGVTFDVILANPPYIAERDWEGLEASVRLYEPREALLGGVDGLEVIRRILAEAPLFLEDGGFLFIEHDPTQKEAVALLGERFGFARVREIFDYTGSVRASLFQVRRENRADSHRL
ncbi:peptide chain release factor N(5)-glutamine methyltransferase [Candidatus Caldatribacterium sp.]|uniref:peptide chain release factor N(5)-glutamine methyltransferase n=1 Tax=Candidatus Caldatribacterium sp. TaxID=2282143 RepID=UPI003846B9CF|nr:peptide chain release factor N(5)-glutamine methyltransferase [Candidatus Caldatribacterium sp.]